MAYANIYWIKLHVELLHDKRFLFECSDKQKWLFIGLLLLAANTKNAIPSDVNYIKNRLNLADSNDEISANIKHLIDTFDGLTNSGDTLKFKNFNRIHNYVYKEREISDRIMGEVPENSIKYVNKNKINSILEKFIACKTYPIYLPDGERDKNMVDYLYKRNGKIIKDLLILAKGDDAKIGEAIDWLDKICTKKNLNWTLETVLKWFPDFLAKGASIQNIPESLRKFL